MIEQTMQELKDEMAELRTAIVALTSAMQSAPVAEKAEEKPKADAGKAKQKAPSISRDDLQDLCMQIVRNDRSKKTAVKEAIAAFGNATTLKDVDEKDLPALKTSLEALK